MSRIASIVGLLAVLFAFTLPAPAAEPTAGVSVEEFRRVQDQVQALAQRVLRLEQANTELAARNTELQRTLTGAAAEADAQTRLQTQTAAGSQTQTAAGTSTPAPAQPLAPAQPPAQTTMPTLTWSGDVRLRHEQVDERGNPTRERDRLLTHFGFEAAVTPDIDVGVQLATGGEDPRSANQTLDETFSRKSIGLDLAYVRWRLTDELTLTGGKMKYPLFRPGQSKLQDSDVNPEGVALGFDNSRFFGSAYGFWLEERAAGADTGVVGLQAGARFTLPNDMKLTTAVAYSDLGAAQGRAPFFAGSSNGNTTNPDGSLTYDFRTLQLGAELGLNIRRLPVSVFADYARNSEAPDDLDTAYAAGFLLGKASSAHAWEFAYVYQHVEKDAWFGQWTDSDFGNGNTDAEGSVLRFGYMPLKNWLLNATYYLNDLNLSDPADGGSTSQFRRLQLDFTVRF